MTILEQGTGSIEEELQTKKNRINGWINEINEGWQKSVDSILKLSTRIAEIKVLLTNDGTIKSWTEFTERKELNITRRTIDRLVQIGNWDIKNDIAHKLPASWGTIHALVLWSQSDNDDEIKRWNDFIVARDEKTPENEIRLNPDITRSEVAKAREGKTKSKDTYKKMIEIQIDKKTYKTGDTWDVKKLQKIKTKLEDIEKITESLAGVKVDTEDLDKAIEETNKNKKTAEANVKRNERKIKQKLANMVDTEVAKNTSFSQRSTEEIEELFHSPGTIESYVKKLKNDLNKSKADDYKKCFMGSFDKAYFEKLLLEK
jgi:hypothetical protein